MSLHYRTLFDQNIDDSFQVALRLLKEFPKSAAAMLPIVAHEAKAKKKRDEWLKEDVSVPPLLIVSTTDQCNLQCKECYAMATCRDEKNEMTESQIQSLLQQASKAGCSTILLAGGEPLLSPKWIHAVANHKELLGLVFTNGTLMNNNWVDFFATHRNLIPLFSIEGTPERTDDRRGSGTMIQIKNAMEQLNAKKIPFGISVTTGQHNIQEVTNSEFIKPYIALGCRLVIYVEYVPMGESTEFLVLTEESKMALQKYCDNNTDKAILIAFPGNESPFDGCLAAGRGFVHVSSSGSLEPCPFAPYSDRNVCESSFIDALKSPLLKGLRAESNRMHEGVGGCSLRDQETWIHEIIHGATQ